MTRQLIAILRGVRPNEIEPIVKALLDTGITKIEVPLNSPDAFTSIEFMCKRFIGQGVFGAGTVLAVEDVQRLADMGAQMVVSPNCDIDVIHATKRAGMQSFPGVMTPSECFTALSAGADGLKFFPGELVGPVGLRAMRAVLPVKTQCYAVGGVSRENFAQWRDAGADGFGIGSAIYKAGDSAHNVHEKAQAVVAAYDEVM